MIEIAELFNNLENKFAVAQDETLKQGVDIKESFKFDELKMYFGEDYWVTDKICIKQPTIGQILEYGDSKFYAMVSTLCANPTSFRLQLWNNGIDWNEISDFELFTSLIQGLTPNETSFLFGDLDLSKFRKFHDDYKNCDILIYLPQDEFGDLIPISDLKDTIIIDEILYLKIIAYIKKMFDINPKVEHAKNKATKKAMIWEDEMNLENDKKNGGNKNKSFLLPLVSALVNHPGFKYKTSELKDIGIYQFMDSAKRLQVYESTTALMKGMYSGFVDGSHLKDKDLNWMRDLS